MSLVRKNTDPVIEELAGCVQRTKLDKQKDTTCITALFNKLNCERQAMDNRVEFDRCLNARLLVNSLNRVAAFSMKKDEA